MFKKILFFALTLISSSTLARADIYRILNTDHDALQARVDLLQQAKDKVEMTYFIWQNDGTGNLMLALAREAARRRVKVHIIVDAFFNSISPAMRLYLLGEGVIIKDYNPFRLFRPSTWLHRMHNKLFIVDGKSLVMGGRNIEDTYFGLAESNYLDRDVFIQGEAALQKSEAFFDELWNAENVMVRIKSLKKETMAAAKAKLDQTLEEAKQHKLIQLNTSYDWAVGQPERPTVQFLHDEPYAIKRAEPIFEQMVKLGAQAQHSIKIETAYLVITKTSLKILKETVDRGVKVRIMTNSLRSTDGIEAQAGYIGYKKELVEMGIELWEYDPAHTHIHIKSALIDDKIAIIGSYNFDPLSASMNLESSSYIEDEGIAQELDAEMSKNLESATQIGLDGKPMGSTVMFPETACSKVLKTQLIRYLLVPFFRGYL